MIFEVRDSWPELPIALGALQSPLLKRIALKLEHSAYHNSKAVIALSPGMKESVCRTGYPSHRVHIIPNACDTRFHIDKTNAGQAWLDRNPWVDGRKLVVYLGTVGRIHGVEYLVQLAKSAAEITDKICFAVVGGGSHLDAVKRRAEELAVLDRNIYFIPPISKAETPEVLAAATAGVSTVIPVIALEANSANKFFDYLAASLPVLVNYGGWQRLLLESSGAGIHIPQDDPDAAAHLLTDYLFDEAVLATARVAAYKLAQTDFSRDRLADRLISVIEEGVA